MRAISHKKNEKVKYLIIITVLFLLASLAFLIWQGFNKQFAPVAPEDKSYIDIVIPEQSTARQVAAILLENDLIHSENAFYSYCKKNDLDKILKAGHYRFSRSQSLAEIVDDLTAGRLVCVSITIPEGYTVEQVGNTLIEKKLCTIEEWETARKKDYGLDFLQDFPRERKEPLEGFLFPDTYLVSEDSSAEEIVLFMLESFKQIWDANFAEAASSRGLSLYDTITIASMIEKEAMRKDEREIISGVINNRLEKGMLLQIDATVLYCLAEQKNMVNYRDLETDSPYNTYKYLGLPPGPISCPGQASIEAALNPQKHSYYYYVSKGDGSHHFSRTYEEHRIAKNKYLD